MASEPTEVGPNSPEAIEAQIAAKREELASKIENLGGATTGTVNEALQTVASAVGTVTDTLDTVGDTVTKLKRMANPETVVKMIRDTVGSIPVKSTVEEHPWATVSAAAAAGFITGLLVFHQKSQTTSYSAAGGIGGRGVFSGLFDKLIDRVGGEVRKMAEQAIDSASVALTQSVQNLVPLFTTTPASQN
nr:DUF3618 domain-containing protein [Fimbriiglobus sp.]